MRRELFWTSMEKDIHVLFVLLDNKSSSRLSSSIYYINCETLNSLLKIHSQSQNDGIKAWLLLLLSACKTLLPLLYHYASTQDLTPFWPRKSCNASSELWEYFWKICPISWIPFSFPRLYFGVNDDLTKILTSLSLSFSNKKLMLKCKLHYLILTEIYFSLLTLFLFN